MYLVERLNFGGFLSNIRIYRVLVVVFGIFYMTTSQSILTIMKVNKMNHFGNDIIKDKVRAKRRLKALEKREAILLKKIRASEKLIIQQTDTVESTLEKIAAIFKERNNYV